MLREIAAVDSRVTVVKLRRNFGQTAGLAAGFDHARGEYIIAMDGDLQHDPDDIPLFLEKIAEGYDIVSGWRKSRVDNFWMRRIPSRMRQLADGQAQRRRHSRLRHHLQGLSPRNPRAGSALRRDCTASFRRWHPGMAHRSAKCRSATSIRERGASHYGISRTFRVFFDLHHDSLPAELPVPAAALLWHGSGC